MGKSILDYSIEEIWEEEKEGLQSEIEDLKSENKALVLETAKLKEKIKERPYFLLVPLRGFETTILQTSVGMAKEKLSTILLTPVEATSMEIPF
jgi:regulator of replication initiation timing